MPEIKVKGVLRTAPRHCRVVAVDDDSLYRASTKARFSAHDQQSRPEMSESWSKSEQSKVDHCPVESSKRENAWVLTVMAGDMTVTFRLNTRLRTPNNPLPYHQRKRATPTIKAYKVMQRQSRACHTLN